eukprot:gene3758-4162_t
MWCILGYAMWCHPGVRDVDPAGLIPYEMAMGWSPFEKLLVGTVRPLFTPNCDSLSPDPFLESLTFEAQGPDDQIDVLSTVLRAGEGGPVGTTIKHAVLRGCKLKHTRWVYGVVIYTGMESKAMKNCQAVRVKRTKLYQQMNIYMVSLFLFLFLLCIAGGVGSAIWNSQNDLYPPCTSPLRYPRICPHPRGEIQIGSNSNSPTVTSHQARCIMGPSVLPWDRKSTRPNSSPPGS